LAVDVVVVVVVVVLVVAVVLVVVVIAILLIIIIIVIIIIIIHMYKFNKICLRNVGVPDTRDAAVCPRGCCVLFPNNCSTLRTVTHVI